MYEIKIKVDETWMNILDVISRNQDGFIWVSVKEEKE